MDFWPWWLVAGLALVIAELFTGDLIFLMIAIGSAAAAAAAFAGVGVIFQAVIGGAVALLLLVFVRPIALKTLRPRHETVTNTPALVGKPAIVIERVHARDGRVKLTGETWSARSEDPSADIPVGADVEVVRIEGATAIVRISRSDSPPTQE